MKHYILFAGTSEGRQLTEYLLTKNVKLTVCTATEYGKELLPEHPNLTVYAERMDQEQMEAFFSTLEPDAILDATHPYATIVTQNIQSAVQNTNFSYYRIIRPDQNIEDEKNLVFVNTIDDAVHYLSKTTGNILSTIGSKELAKLCSIPDYQDRVYARILSNPDMVKKSYEEGFKGQHLICMQGPFSLEMNIAMIHQFNISYVLTKNTGDAGGFLDKVHSAQKTGCTLIIIGRPVKDEKGYTLEQIKEIL